MMKTCDYLCKNGSILIAALRALGMAGVIFWCGMVSAENVIKAVSGQYKGGLEVLTIHAQDLIEVDPVSFSTQTPPRIAFDFVGYNSAVERSAIPLGLRNAKSAVVIQANGRTRVILNLQSAAPYMIVRSGTSFEVQLADVASEAPSKHSPVGAVQPSSAGGSAVKDVDFRRAPDGAGRVVIDLPVQQAEADVSVKGKTLVIDLPKYSLSAALKRRLDVSDFGTPVQTIISESTPTGARITIIPKGNWEHSAYQTDGRLVVDIRDQKIDVNKVVQGAGYAGSKITLNFQDIDVRRLLAVFSEFDDRNIVMSESVQGSISIRLKDVPWDQALDVILQIKGLDKRLSGNIIRIAPKEELAAKEKADLESKVSVENLESVRTDNFKLNYAKAAEVAAQLNVSKSAVQPGSSTTSPSTGGSSLGGILSFRGSAVSEPRTNQVFVTDIPSRLIQVQEYISKLDIPVRQVLIEARIVEADERFGRSLGVRLGGGDMRGARGGDPGYSVGGGNRVVLGGSYDALLAPASQTIVGSGTADFYNFPVTIPQNATGSPATFAVSLFSAAANRFLNLELSALEADSRGKVVSSPRVVTTDQVKASVEQGVDVPYFVSTDKGPTLNFKKASLILDVTPQITPEGAVILDVQVNKDTVGQVFPQGVAINTKRVQTQVLVENGGTVVIGGIFESKENEDKTQVPFLGDLPVIGNAFKNRSKSSNKTEMLIFITPRVINESVRVQ